MMRDTVVCMNNTTKTMTIDDVEYAQLKVRVCDRVAYRTVKLYTTSNNSLSQVWAMWRGLNVDGDRYTKTLEGQRPGAARFARIAFVG